MHANTKPFASLHHNFVKEKEHVVQTCGNHHQTLGPCAIPDSRREVSAQATAPDEDTDWKTLLESIYTQVKPNAAGKVADYIPRLANADPTKFGISFVSADGKTAVSVGDTSDRFCLQSCCKPLNYCLARSLQNEQEGGVVHAHVGYEPSGRAFNEFVLNREGLPHNPLINAGAIMVASLIKPTAEPSHRFDVVRRFYKKMAGATGHIGFDNSVMLSEKHHADRNLSLAYYMRENGAYAGNPTPSQLADHLDL